VTAPSGDTSGDVRGRRAAIGGFVVALVGGVLAVVARLADDDTFPDISGIGLALALAGIGFGLAAWAKSLGFDEHVIEQRKQLALTEGEERALRTGDADLPEAPARRRTLALLFGGSLAVLGFGLLGPIGSLGSLAQGDRTRTRWRTGVRLATPDGQPVAADVQRFDQLITVFPADALDSDDSQVVLLRVRPDLLRQGTVDAGAVEGWVAYSKICTHAGCSIGLFAIDNRPPIEVRELVCPCHQSVFDPLDRARPVGGPATRPLPQLRLAVDDDGFLVAEGDFDQPVGPIAWDEG
jgi:ubiquinol-cytochrome c reductase iron-sulfur subunit